MIVLFEDGRERKEVEKAIRECREIVKEKTGTDISIPGQFLNSLLIEVEKWDKKYDESVVRKRIVLYDIDEDDC